MNGGPEGVPVHATPERVPRTQILRKEQAIYRLLSQDGKLIYVGSSTNIQNRRGQHNTAISLGSSMEILERHEGVTSRFLRDREDYYIQLYRSQGLTVVNPTNVELYAERGRQTLAKVPKSVLSDRMRHANASKTHEQRVAAAHASWATRKAKKMELAS